MTLNARDGNVRAFGHVPRQPNGEGRDGYCEVISDDPCEHARCLPLWTQDYVQVTKGAFVGTLAYAQLGEIRLFREAMNQAVVERCDAPPDSFCIGIPIQVSAGGYWQSRAVESTSLLCLQPGEPLLFRAPGSSDILVVTIDAKTLANRASESIEQDIERLVSRSQGKRLALKTAAHYRNLIGEIISTVRFDPDVLGDKSPTRSIVDDLIDSSIDVLSEISDASRSSYRPRYAQRHIVECACEYVLTRCASPPSMEELSGHLHMSQRGMHHAFVNVTGLSPAKYLRNVRLHQARTELLHSGAQARVCEIAHRWGFGHMGMFSSYYKSLFGESPSATLRKSARN